MLKAKTYQAKKPTGRKHTMPNWFVVDAKDLVVGRLATVLARVITGKHKPSVTPHVDQGDVVVVLNSDKVAFTRNKWDQKMYYSHSGFISGLKAFTAKEMLVRDPKEILRRAVWGMTDKSSLSRKQMKKLKLFVGEKHGHAAQNPQPLPKNVTRRTIFTAPKPAGK